MNRKKQKCKFLFLVLIGLGFGSSLLAADFYSIKSGNWHSKNNWSNTPGGPRATRKPAAGDVVYLENNYTITARRDEACSSITFTGNGAELIVRSTRTISVSGLITLNKQSASNSGCTISGDGSLYCLGVEVGSTTNAPSGWFSTNSHTMISSVANMTISGNLTINSYWSLIYNLRNGVFNLESGTLTVGGQIRGINSIGTKCTFSMDAGSGDGTLILQGADPFDLDLGTDVLDLNGAASLVDYARAGSQNVIITDYNNVTFSGSGVKTFSGTGSTSIYGIMSMEGTATASGSAPVYGGNATLQYKGSAAQTSGIEFPATFSGSGGVIIDNSSGLSLNGSRSITRLLTFLNGVISTGSYTLSLASGGSVIGAGAASYVNGSFEKGIASATGTKTFEIGDVSGYTPVVLDFTGNTNGTGNILAFTTPGDHPQLASSQFSSSKTVNRYWTLTNNGVSGFTEFDANFTFLPADADAGTDAAAFVVGNYNPSSWTYPTTGLQTGTSTQGTGLNTFGAFQIGQTGAAFRSAASGNWELITSWETFDAGSWIPATSYPTSGSNAITIQSSHTISTTTSFSVDEFTINAGAALVLGADMTVADGAGTDFMVNGMLDCGGIYTLSGPGSFFLNFSAEILVGSPEGITLSGASGNIQTSSRYFDIDASYTYQGTAAQLTGDALPATVNNLKIDNTSGVSLTASTTINGTLTLTNGALITGATTLGFQNSDTPIVRASGTITTSASTDLVFGTSGNTGGAAFVIPDGTFTTAPGINKLTINRINNLTLNDQMLSIGGILLCNGPLITTGNLTLLSDASATALIDGASTGTVSGNVSMQRYLPVGFGYKYFSSPFQGATVSEFGDDMDLGSSFPTFYKYDESNTSSGWESYVDPAGVLSPMHGYSVNFGSVSAPNTVDVNGEVNNGPLSLMLQNNDNTYTLGLNLVGNPYPSAIDWDAASGWTKTNIDNAIYYFNASGTDHYSGTYSSYVNGVSSDGNASNIIPSMQGFFVHVSDGAYPVSGTLGMNNNVRITDRTQYFAKSTSSDGEDSAPLIRLNLMFTDDSASGDPFVLYLDELATEGFDPDLDARKLLNPSYAVPNLYALLPKGEILSIEAISVFSEMPIKIPLGVKTNQKGELSFGLKDFASYFSQFEITLFDSLTGLRHKLSENVKYTLSLEAGEYHGRFFLELMDLSAAIREPLVPAELFTAYAYEDFIKVKIYEISGGSGQLSLYGIDGRVIFRQEVPAPGDYEFELPANQGIYIVSYMSGMQLSSVKLFIGKE